MVGKDEEPPTKKRKAGDVRGEAGFGADARELELTDQPWQTDPVLDLIQASHDQLYSRLFVS